MIGGSGGGGWGSPWLCKNVNEDAWLASASELHPVYYNGELTIDFLDGYDEDFYVYIPEYHVQYCGDSWDTNTWAYLVGPDGLQRSMEVYADGKDISYAFSDTDPDGIYEATIVTASGTLTGQVSLQREDYLDYIYSGPIILLRDPHNQPEAVEFQPGQPIHVQFMRGQPLSQAVAGLYQVMGSRMATSFLVLLNSWPVQYNRTGEYELTLDIPPDAVPGEYMIFLTNNDALVQDYLGRFGSLETGPMLPRAGAAGYFFSLWKSDEAISAPESVVASFYRTLNEALVMGEIGTLDTFVSQQLLANGFSEQFWLRMTAVSSIGLEGISLRNATTNAASVQVNLLQVETAAGGRQRSHQEVTWDLVRENGEWKLDNVVGYDDTPLSPVDMTLAFYRALDAALTTRDYHFVYSLLSSNRKASRTYDSLKALYADTYDIEVESIELIDEQETQATVHVIVRTSDRVAQGSGTSRYDVIYGLVKENGSWRMDTPVIQQLGN